MPSATSGPLGGSGRARAARVTSAVLPEAPAPAAADAETSRFQADRGQPESPAGVTVPADGPGTPLSAG